MQMWFFFLLKVKVIQNGKWLRWIPKENHFSTSLEYKLISKLRRNYAFEARLNKCIQEYQLQIIYHFNLKLMLTWKYRFSIYYKCITIVLNLIFSKSFKIRKFSLSKVAKFRNPLVAERESVPVNIPYVVNTCQ